MVLGFCCPIKIHVLRYVWLISLLTHTLSLLGQKWGRQAWRKLWTFYANLYQIIISTTAVIPCRIYRMMTPTTHISSPSLIACRMNLILRSMTQ